MLYTCNAVTKTVNIILVSLFFLFLAESCKKDEPYQKPVVRIISPVVNEIVNTPGNMGVKLSVDSRNMIKYIRVNIDNDQQVPLFTPMFLYPDSTSALIDEEMFLGSLQHNETEPFYLHIAVDDGVNLNHYYQPIRVNPADMQYRGFYMITRPSVNRTEVKYYNTTLQYFSFAMIDGEYIDSEISANNDMLYVATHIPARLTAFEFEDQYLKWTKEPEMPYPEYIDLYYDVNFLFSATGSGRIVKYRALSGNQQAITTQLKDSVAMKICADGEYIIGDFKARTGPGKSWVVFYQETGIPFQKYQAGNSVVDFYPVSEGDGFYVFGNTGEHGEFVKYQVTGNYISARININYGLIGHTCRIDEQTFLISIGRDIYRFSTIVQYPFKLLVLSEDIVDMKYDPADDQLFVASGDDVKLYAYPGMQFLSSIPSQNPVKAINLRYGY